MIIHIKKDKRNRLMMSVVKGEKESKELRIRARFKGELLNELTHHLFSSQYAAVLDDPAIKGAIDMVESSEPT